MCMYPTSVAGQDCSVSCSLNFHVAVKGWASALAVPDFLLIPQKVVNTQGALLDICLSWAEGALAPGAALITPALTRRRSRCRQLSHLCPGGAHTGLGSSKDLGVRPPVRWHTQTPAWVWSNSGRTRWPEALGAQRLVMLHCRVPICSWNRSLS